MGIGFLERIEAKAELLALVETALVLGINNGLSDNEINNMVESLVDGSDLEIEDRVSVRDSASYRLLELRKKQKGY